MLHETIVENLKKEFPASGIAINEPPQPIAVFAAQQDAVGKAFVYVDGGEAIVEIEKITHGHFANYDEKLSEEERNQQIAEAVVDFLEALFDDRVLLFVNEDSRIGGWRRLDLTEDVGPLSPDYRHYFWSKPYE